MLDTEQSEPIAASLLIDIAKLEQKLERRFANRIIVNHELDRTLVSFQANKREAEHRWCKYKEGFSAALIRYLIRQLKITGTAVLDPFAGSGTALFAASEMGLNTVGIEILPSSAEIIETRALLARCKKKPLTTAIRKFVAKRPWASPGPEVPFNHLAITKGAFPVETERLLGRYLFEASKAGDKLLQRTLRFAAVCVLESISFTRKDGQYLRWDYRSGRRQGEKKFDKGEIRPFGEAIIEKLDQIASDLDDSSTLFSAAPVYSGEISLRRGSCLDILPTLPDKSFGAIITSPPYCNRYDYTRTYALELAMEGIGEDEMRALRQTLLSCTVENRTKTDLDKKSSKSVFEASQSAVKGQALLKKIVQYLEWCRESKTINNTGIPRMVRGYFEELALAIFECARVVQSGGIFVMVNDNVRYQGAHVPVDLILSDFAEQAGFEVEAIWVLPRGKGNSSQQMGSHGRQEIRKCVYVWRRK